jgi:beta-phosphoglucomutase-like phosphatase (HAD superfamily)
MTDTTAHPTVPEGDAEYAAVIFDMDGVVTDTARLHAAAWQALFDQTLPQLPGGAHVAPFDIDADYRAYIDGRSREDGVRAWLASRGLQIPDGSPADPLQTLTVYGLAARKQQLFTDQIAQHGVTAYPSTVALLERLRADGVPAGLVTASRNSQEILAAAGVADMFTTIVDGTDAAQLDLAGKPAPDLFLVLTRRFLVGLVIQVRTVPGGQAERMAGRVGVHETVVGVRLEVEPGGAGSDCARAGCLEVVDEEVEVHLHGYDGAGPHRWAEVVDLLECDEPVRPGDGRPMRAPLRDAAGELRIEPRESERVGRVHRGPAEPDLVGHHSTTIAW